MDRLINFDNERDLEEILPKPKGGFLRKRMGFFLNYPTRSNKLQEELGNNRSVMPIDILGLTRFTMDIIKSFIQDLGARGAAGATLPRGLHLTS